MFRFISSNILMFIGLVFFAVCATVPAREEPPLQVVSQVDINRYLGRWYEIARYPNWFQESCYAVTADYELSEDGFIKVVNRCKDRELNGEIREALGKAHIRLVESLAERNFDMSMLKATPIKQSVILRMF